MSRRIYTVAFGTLAILMASSHWSWSQSSTVVPARKVQSVRIPDNDPFKSVPTLGIADDVIARAIRDHRSKTEDFNPQGLVPKSLTEEAATSDQIRGFDEPDPIATGKQDRVKGVSVDEDRFGTRD